MSEYKEGSGVLCGADYGLFWKIGGRALERLVIIIEDAMCRAVQVFVLVRIDRPQEAHKSKQSEPECNGNEVDDDVHASALLFMRKAFNVTISDEADIAIAAIKGVTFPVTAIGTAIIL